MTDGSGRNFTDSLMYYDRATSSWKTSQACLPLMEDQPFGESLPTLPPAGTMRSGIVYPQPPLVPRTSGTGSSSSPAFPTPSATEPGFNPDTRHPVDKHGNPPTHPNQRWYDPKTGRLMQKGLPQVAKLWPTPKSSISGPDYARVNRPRSGGDDLATAAARWPTNQRLWRTPQATDGDHGGPHARDSGGGLHLSAQVHKWPTPTAQDAKNCAGPSQWDRNSDPLNVAVQRWPTPTTSDASGGGNRNSAGSKAHAGVSLTDACLTGDSSTPRSVVSGQLNPQWVGWLMGFPIGWLNLKP